MMMSPDNRHKLALPYWARPGISTVVKPDDGGGKDDDLDDDDDDDDDDEDDDPDEDKTEEELRAELKAVRESLSKASGSSKSKRDKIKRLERELTDARVGKAKPKAKADDDDDTKVDAEAIREAAKAEALAEAAKTRKADKAEVALARAGVNDKRLAKAVKLLDLDDLDLNDDGTLDGFDEQLADLKRDWPELFTKPRKRSSVAGEGDRNGDNDRKVDKNKSASQRQADALLKGGR